MRILIVLLILVLLAAAAAWLIFHQSPTPGPETIVYITDTGECYHRASCGSLSFSRRPMSLAQARQNYRPCKRCRPPD